MGLVKQKLWEDENEPSLTDLEEYELYCLFSKMNEKGINLDFFEPLMEEGGKNDKK